LNLLIADKEVKRNN